jgi:hypothetical protein
VLLVRRDHYAAVEKITATGVLRFWGLGPTETNMTQSIGFGIIHID